MNIDDKAEEILDKITVGLHHPQFREAIITCMKEFGDWQVNKELDELKKHLQRDVNLSFLKQKDVDRISWYIDTYFKQKQTSND